MPEANLELFRYHLVHIIRQQRRMIYLFKKLRFRAWTLLIRFRSNKDLDVNKIIWINQKKIKYSALELNLFNIGRVIGGDWDKSTKKFEDRDTYMDLRRRFIEGTKWNNTRFYKYVLGKLERGRIYSTRKNLLSLHLGIRTKNELDKEMKRIDHLYYEIKTNGYKSKKAIKKDGYKSNTIRENPFENDPMESEDEITVNIGRNGALFFNDGVHRLSIAKILKIPKIPVKVIIRHTEWMKLRKDLLELASKREGKINQSLTHPDLQDILAHYREVKGKKYEDT